MADDGYPEATIRKRPARKQTSKQTSKQTQQKSTLKQIADMVGVSTATVSRVLSPGPGSGSVKEETRRRVLEAAREFAPRSRKKTLTIGVMVPTLTQPAYAELAQSLITHLSQEGFSPIVTTPAEQAADSDAQHAAVNTLLDQDVAGIIAAPGNSPESGEAWKLATDRRLPIIFVALDGDTPNLFTDVIRFADRIAAKAATYSLLDQGHSRIGVLSGPGGHPVTDERLQGIREVFGRDEWRQMAEEGLVQYSPLGLEPRDQRTREETVRKLLKQERPPTAIFALDMRLCQSALHVIRRLKLTIPSEISLVTFADAARMANSSSQIRLTTITHSMDQLATRAVQQLRLRIEIAQQQGMAMERMEINVNPEIRNPSASVGAINYKRFEQDYQHYLRKHSTSGGFNSEPAIAIEDQRHQAQNLLELGRLDLKLARYGTIPLMETEPGRALAPAILEQPPRLEDVEAHSSSGVEKWFEGKPEDAEKHFMQGYQDAKKLDEQHPSVKTRELVGEFLTRLGKLKGNQGEYEQARAYLREGLRLIEGRDMPGRRGEFLMHLGWIEGNLGDYVTAGRLLEDGLAEAGKLARTEPLNADKLSSGLRMNLGWIAHCRGEFERAEKLLREGLTEARRYNLQIRMCGLLENLSAVERYRGNEGNARKLVDEGLSLPQQKDHPPRRCGLLQSKAWNLIDTEDYDEARRVLEEGFALAARMFYPLRICEFLLASGCLDLLQARASTDNPQQREMRLGDASSEFMTAHLFANKIKHRFLRNSADIWLGEFYLERMNGKEALRLFGRAHRASVEYHDHQQKDQQPGDSQRGQAQRTLTGWAEYGMARACAVLGDTKGAREHGAASLKALSAITGLQRFGMHKVADVAAWLRAYDHTQASPQSRQA